MSDDRAFDLTGKQFDRLTVLRRDGFIEVGKNKARRRAWLCRCSCGVEKRLTTDALRSGNTRSCGCLNKDVVSNVCRKPPGEAAFNNMLAQYKRGAKIRGIRWAISDKAFRELTKMPCAYCGMEPRLRGTKKTTTKYAANGIDRVHNDYGYIPGNVVPCCTICNRMKMDHSKKEFLQHVKRICEYNGL